MENSDQMNKRRKIDVNQMLVENIIMDMQSNDPLSLACAKENACKMLAGKFPPIEILFRNGIVPICVDFLESSETNLQLEAAQALTNIASGTLDQTRTVAKSGAIQKFVSLLGSKLINVAEQSAWALDKIASAEPDTRDQVLENIKSEDLFKISTKNQFLTLQRNIVRLMSKLCANENRAPPADKVEFLVPALARFLESEDHQIMTYATCAISYIIGLGVHGIQAVVNNNCLKPLFKLFHREQLSIAESALCSVEIICDSGDEQIAAVIKTKLLGNLDIPLNSDNDNSVEKAVKIIRTITSSNEDRIASVINARLLQNLCPVLRNGGSKSKEHSAWIVTNITAKGNEYQISYVCDGSAGILQPFCDLMADPDCMRATLTGIQNLFQRRENFLEMFKQIGGPKKLKELKNQDCDVVRTQVHRLLQMCFPEADNLGPAAE